MKITRNLINLKNRRICALLVALLMITILPVYSFAASDTATIKKDVAFSGLTSKENIKSVEFNSSYFAEKADTYNHDLAQLSVALCAAAGGKTQTNIEKAFAGFGFTNDEVYDKNSYARDYTTNKDVAGYAFASKDITVGGDKYKLIAIAVRSTKGAEWYSNFNINDNAGGAQYHEGFVKAEAELMTNLTKYVQNLNVNTDKTKILVTGHSRGGGIANILAGELSADEKLASRENIYGYTFAAPNSVASISTNYSNIYNIINPADFVANLPLSEWGYTKYGSVYALPCEKDAGYTALLEKAGAEFNAITGLNYEPLALSQTTAFLDNIYAVAPTASDCYNKAVAFDGGSVTLKQYFDTLAGILSEGKGLMSFMQYSSGELGGLTNYFAANQVFGNGIKHSHAVETYISWLAVTDAAQLQKDALTTVILPANVPVVRDDVPPLENELSFDFYRDCYASVGSNQISFY